MKHNIFSIFSGEKSRFNNKQLRVIILVLLTSFFILPAVHASLGNFKSGDCVDIKTILNTSSVNISSISGPNMATFISNKDMTKSGRSFNYTFCNTSAPGKYIYDYFDAEGNTYVNDFSVGGSLITAIFLFVGAFLLLAFGMIIKNEYLGFISGALFISGGIYIMIYGLSNFADIYTRIIGFVGIGLGFIFTIIAFLEIIKDWTMD